MQCQILLTSPFPHRPTFSVHNISETVFFLCLIAYSISSFQLCPVHTAWWNLFMHFLFVFRRNLWENKVHLWHKMVDSETDARLFLCNEMNRCVHVLGRCTMSLTEVEREATKLRQKQNKTKQTKSKTNSTQHKAFGSNSEVFEQDRKKGAHFNVDTM